MPGKGHTFELGRRDVAAAVASLSIIVDKFDQSAVGEAQAHELQEMETAARRLAESVESSPSFETIILSPDDLGRVIAAAKLILEFGEPASFKWGDVQLSEIRNLCERFAAEADDAD